MRNYKTSLGNQQPLVKDQNKDKQPEKQFITKLNIPKLLGVIAALTVVLVVYYLRLNKVVGHPYVDDAYYLLLAKALATGYGYTLINTPTPGIMPFYPPMYPLLLAGILKLSAPFPQNLWLLKLFSVSSLVAGGGRLLATFTRFVNYQKP